MENIENNKIVVDKSKDNTKNISRSHKKNIKSSEIKSKTKVSDIFLYIGIILTFAYLVFTVVDLFKSISSKELSVFTNNFLLAFIMIIITTLLYLFLLYFEKSKYELPEWFRCVIITFIYIFTIIYTMFNLYNYFAFSIVFYAVIGFILSIIAISIFYNYLKDSKNILKISPFMVFLFGLCFAVTIGVLIQLVVILTKDLNQLKTASAPVYLDFYINLGMITLSSIISNFVMYMSLKKSKKLINASIIYSKK